MAVKGTTVDREQALTTRTSKDIFQVLRSEETRMEIERALSNRMPADRFIRIIQTALRSRAGLAQCTRDSIMTTMLEFAQLGIEPETGLQQGWLVPFKGECKPMFGYRGLIVLANRSPEIKSLRCHLVYKGDDYHVEYGDKPVLRHIPKNRTRSEDEFTDVYCILTLKSNETITVDMTREQVVAHRKRYEKNKTGSTGVTMTMADYGFKTCIRQMMKVAPIDTATMVEITRAFEADDQGNDEEPPIVTNPISVETVQRDTEESNDRGVVDQTNHSFDDYPASLVEAKSLDLFGKGFDMLSDPELTALHKELRGK